MGIRTSDAALSINVRRLVPGETTIPSKVRLERYGNLFIRPCSFAEVFGANHFRPGAERSPITDGRRPRLGEGAVIVHGEIEL